MHNEWSHIIAQQEYGIAAGVFIIQYAENWVRALFSVCDIGQQI